MRNSKRTAGYTLLELAIVMVVSGILIAGGASAYRIYREHQVFATTVSNIDYIMDSLNIYLMQNGSYPCPASLTAPRDSTEYGMEGDCTDTAVAIGVCDDTKGICIEQSQSAGNPRVRRGAVPFRLLNIPESMSLDGYNNRLQFVMTEPLGDRSTFNGQKGGISVMDAQSPARSIVNPADSAHFIIFTTGPNLVGAYSREGKRVLPCTGASLDVENCNTATTTNEKLAIYRLTSYSSATGASGFDDIMKYYTSADIPLWKANDPDIVDIVDNIEAGTNVDNHIGLGGATPSKYNMLQVTGNVKVSPDPVDPTSGSLKVREKVCNVADDANCVEGFKPELLAGNPDSADPLYSLENKDKMYCPPGQYISEIKNGGKAGCKFLASAKAACTTGEYLIGINADGTLNCAATAGTPDCPATQRWICADSLTHPVDVPPGVFGETHDVVPKDITPDVLNDYMAHYQLICDPSQKRWICNEADPDDCKTYNTLCEACVAGTVTSAPQVCNDNIYGFWTGTYTFDEVTTCTGRMVVNYTNDTRGTTCLCTAGSYPGTKNCPYPQKGAGTPISTNWVCDSASKGHWEAPVATGPADCTCSGPEPHEDWDGDCPVGQVGKGNKITWATNCDGSNTPKTKTGEVDCAPPVCKDKIGLLDYESCPVGEVGSGIEYSYDLLCPDTSTRVNKKYTGGKDCEVSVGGVGTWEDNSSATAVGVPRPAGMPLWGSPCNLTDAPRVCWKNNGNTYDCVCQ